MKTTIVKISILSLLYSLMGIGCKDECETCSTDVCRKMADDIIGKWKLVKGEEVFFNPKTVDYSHNNIFYQFQADSTLTITSDINDIMGLGAGQHSYEFNLSDDKRSCRLNIEHIQGEGSISGSNLILNYADLDGPILYFTLNN